MRSANVSFELVMRAEGLPGLRCAERRAAGERSRQDGIAAVRSDQFALTLQKRFTKGLTMDARIQSLLAEYHLRAESEWKLMNELPPDQLMSRLDDFLLPVGESSGTLLNILVKAQRAKTILELGTSYGYSTVWLAEAAKETDGRVVTLELSAEKSAYAKAQLGRVGLDAFVDFRVGDALETLENVPGPIDFVLVDL
jgi:predicted O-methyltransferase YrrM